MDGDTGLTLFEPSEIKLNIIGNEEEDEEALEDQKRRDQVLKEQLENAFDDWTDDEDTATDKNRKQNICRSPKSSTDDDEIEEVNTTNDKDRVRNEPIISKVSSRGKIFHNLSDISERSLNKSDCLSSENSGVFSSGTEQSPSTDQFSGLMDGKGNMNNQNQLIFKNSSYNKRGKKFLPILAKTSVAPSLQSGNDNSYTRTALDRRGAFDSKNQPTFKNMPYNKNDDKFVPLFIKSPLMNQLSGNEEAYRLAAMDGSGDFDRRNHPVLNQSSEQFQPLFVKPPSVEQSLDESEDAYKQAELNSENQLKVLYQVRLKEIQQLNKQLEVERNEAAAYKQQTVMQMALLQSEKERAVLSRTEADKLLVASKEEISNIQKEVEVLKQKLETIEKEKKQSVELLELSKVEIQELEDRIALMERCDNSMRQSKQTNLMVKNLKSRHQEEVGLLQNQLETVTKKLQEKEEESRSLEQRLDQLTVEKASTISQLTRSLEDSQRQCQQLLETNVMAENVTLNHQLNQVLHERDQLTQTVNSLREECRSMKSELETVSQTDSMVQMGISRSRSRSNDNSTNLQAELHRALLNQKAKRAEVERLQNIVLEKEKEIQEIKRNQQISLDEKESLNDELNQVKEELYSLRSKYEEVKKKSMKSQDESRILLEQALQKSEDKTANSEEATREVDLRLKESSVRLEQSLREVKELKEMYLGVTTELGVFKTQLQVVTEERDRINTQLQASLNQASLLQKEKNDLLSEIRKLKDQDNLQNNGEEQLRTECARLQNELSTMSARHTQELSSARTELQATRDRVSQLEKTARLQFDTKIKALYQERDMLKTKCDEKEVQIKKLIESRKRVPTMANVATETEKEEVDWHERLEKELAHCRKEYEATLAFMEKVHQDVVKAMQQKHLEDKENLHQTHVRAIAELEQQLVIVEEQTKEKTIHFFSEKVQELEIKYQEELNRISNSSEVVRLKTEVADQSRKIEILSESLERANEAVRIRMQELAIERETERRHVALLMEQWSQEMKSTQEELKLKDENMKQLKLKLESAKYCAKTNHDKLVKTNKELIESMNNKLAGYRSKVKANIETYEKDVWDKVQKIESVYRRREKRLHQEFKKQLMVDL